MMQMTHLLDIAQRHARVLSWAAVYAVFVTLTLRHLDAPDALIVSAGSVVPMVVTSELLRHWLIPRYLQRRVWIFLCLLLPLVWVVVTGAVWCDRHVLQWLGIPLPGARDGNHGDPRIYFYAKHSYLILITAIQAIVSYLLGERKRLVSEVRENQMQLELKYLRSQINPHFLFNSLNTIYALTVMKDELAPASVLKLSEMLRYVIDDCQAESVPLGKEVRYLENFIAFFRLRMEHEADITFTVRGLDQASAGMTASAGVTATTGMTATAGTAAGVMVPPMIFQPMVENSLKHSRIAEQPDAFVRIALTLEGGTLTFTTENSLPAQRTADTERLGIGMANVRQRLDLLYGTAYTLDTEEADGTYRLRLTLKW